ncbi:MAG: EF-P beta-lysylation protein EpmB [Gammaproteobacteria bacterium]|nr:EF-P beta-lysylation protein EpmB [Gammaproteobacteria bacterium]
MKPLTASSWRPAPWQAELARAVKDPAELLRMLELDDDLLPQARRAAELFPLRVPRGFITRMRKGDVLDPLLLQVLPLDRELEVTPDFSTDPVGDLAAMTVPGVLHKYHGRVLLVLTGACAVHCRYCFRRHFPYSEANPATDHWSAALDYIRADPSIREVILSGGDPLALSDARLAELVAQLDTIPQLQRLRIHTRVPVVLPERVDAALLQWLTSTRLAVVMVLHVNHARELDATTHTAFAELERAGVRLYNQAVLLRGINDTAQALQDLSEALFAARVTPYYLHLLDRVSGAAHFEISEARARTLMDEIHTRLPGYLVPRLVREAAAAPYKTPVPITTATLRHV